MEESKAYTSPIFFFFGIWLIFGVLFNFAVTNAASTYIVGDLGGSGDIASYSISFFGLGNTLTIPLALSLGARIGEKKLLHIALIGFFIVSLILGFAPNYPIFNALRFLQGCTSGPLFILISHFITTFGTPRQKSHLMKYILASFILAPSLATAWGGTLAYLVSWRWIFYFDLIPLLISCILLWTQLDRLPESTERKPFDLVGYIFYCLSFFCFGFFVIMGQELDWFRSDLLCTVLLIAVISFPFFLLWTFRHPYPIMEFRLLKNPNLLFSLIQLAFLFSSYFGMTILFALWLKLDVNYTLLWISAILLAVTFSAGVLMYIMTKLHSLDRRVSLALSIFILSLSCFYSMYFNVEINLGRIAFSRILAGIGLALFLHPLMHMTFEAVEECDRLSALVFFQLFRAFPSTLGVAFYTTLWLRRDVFFHERLGEALNYYSEQTKEFLTKAKFFHLTDKQQLAELNHLLDRQAKSLALNDTFYFMGLILLALFVYLLLTFLFKSFHLKTTVSKE